jgi:outer membrane receptor protein involved in Fe transport
MKEVLLGRSLLTAIAAATALTGAGSGWAAEPAEAPASLEPVIVKGEKLERTLSETQSSVSVNTEADLRQHADRTMMDVLVRTPGVYTTAGNENWGIRGIPVSGFDDQGPAALNGAVSVYVDGALQPNRALTLSPLLLWDVEQIEIFRGAQSTVQGRNALAGAVVVQTRNPTYEPSLAAQINAGNYGERGAAAAVGGAIVDGTVAGRLSFDFQESDGYIRNEALDEDADRRRSTNVRGKLLVQPADQLDALVTLAHSRNRQGNNSVAQIDDEPRYFDVFLNTEEFDRIEQNTASLKLDYYLNDAWTLTSTTATTRSTYDALLDFDENPTDRMEVVREHEARLTSEELRLAYRSPGLRGHVGAYYGRSTNRFDDQLNVEDAPFGAVLGRTKIVNRALFGELDWHFAPRLVLTAGLRHDRERNDTDVTQDDFSSPAASSRNFKATLPKLGLNYTVAPGQQVGLTAQRGYRSGGVNVRAGASHAPYQPEYTTTVELAYRGVFLDQRLRTSANVYRTNWKDQQVSLLDSSGNFFEVQNAARSRIRGLETQADYDLDAAWRFSIAFAYNDARYRRFTLADGGDLGGQAFLFAPRSMWTMGTRYRSGPLILNADFVWRRGSPSEYLFGDDGDVEGVRRGDDEELLNLAAEYRVGKGVTVTAYVRNLLDERYVINNRSGSAVDVGAPRRFGALLRYEL